MTWTNPIPSPNLTWAQSFGPFQPPAGGTDTQYSTPTFDNPGGASYFIRLSVPLGIFGAICFVQVYHIDDTNTIIFTETFPGVLTLSGNPALLRGPLMGTKVGINISIGTQANLTAMTPNTSVGFYSNAAVTMDVYTSPNPMQTDSRSRMDGDPNAQNDVSRYPGDSLLTVEAFSTAVGATSKFLIRPYGGVISAQFWVYSGDLTKVPTFYIYAFTIDGNYTSRWRFNVGSTLGVSSLYEVPIPMGTTPQLWVTQPAGSASALSWSCNIVARTYAW